MDHGGLPYFHQPGAFSGGHSSLRNACGCPTLFACFCPPLCNYEGGDVDFHSAVQPLLVIPVVGTPGDRVPVYAVPVDRIPVHRVPVYAVPVDRVPCERRKTCPEEQTGRDVCVRALGGETIDGGVYIKLTRACSRAVYGPCRRPEPVLHLVGG